MTPRLLPALLTLLATSAFAADDYQPGPDSLPQAGVAKGQMLKDMYLAKDGSVFPGTEREYQIYLPAGLDAAKPSPFMVFQDGVIYQAPTVFDNLIARKDIPAMIGIFIKPGVVPAANANALPRFNRSYEYDSVTDSYARFLIDEFLPAIKSKHKLNLSDNPNARAIAGNSSGGICAFMVGWHRPDQFRRIFTGVGTYVGIHGADQLPVLVRKFEPKPLRVYLQSGENDNNLYCGDWWMANQTMERSLTWNGYDVNHTWGTGGHNAKHATAIFPDVLRWLWKGYPDEPVKANPRGDAKWVGGQVVGGRGWEEVEVRKDRVGSWSHLAANEQGEVFASESTTGVIVRIRINEMGAAFGPRLLGVTGMAVGADGKLCLCVTTPRTAPRKSGVKGNDGSRLITLDQAGEIVSDTTTDARLTNIALAKNGNKFVLGEALSGAFDGFIAGGPGVLRVDESGIVHSHNMSDGRSLGAVYFALSPDQTQIYASLPESREVHLWKLAPMPKALVDWQPFVQWEQDISSRKPSRQRSGGICVDTNGWLYIATSIGIQVCDQCGRVNFIIPTPVVPSDICFGSEGLNYLFIACGDKIYKRHTKAHGYISGQMAPIKPPASRL